MGESDDQKSETRDHSHDESERNEHSSEDKTVNNSELSKPTMDDAQDNAELDYSNVDPLELARQVAVEVEREVGGGGGGGGGEEDNREPSSSSSEKKSSSEIRKIDSSPDNSSGKDSEPIDGIKDLASGSETVPELQGNDPEKCQKEVTQEPEIKAEMGLCSENNQDHPVDQTSTLISVVSASKAEAVPGLPVSPLKFEGSLGWKGTAATSAFRAPSPRRTTPENNHQRLSCLDFDLNVADDDKATDLPPGKELQFLSPPFDVGSVQPRSDKLKLDLNLVSDDGDGGGPSDWRIEGGTYLRNGRIEPSPSSSSSSMQPRSMNIDLNDQPFFFNDSSDHHHSSLGKSYQNLNAFVGLKSDDTVISIMGTRVEVKRKQAPPPQTLPFLNGGSVLQPPMDVNWGAPLSYGHSPPVYGYNGFTSTPPLPFSSTIYGPGGPAGPIPYMVDSRGGAHVPAHFLGSSQSRPPFVMNLAGPSSSTNGLGLGPGPSRHNFDLNFGSTTDAGSTNPLGFRQLFVPDSNQPPPPGGAGVRRKEPDSGWDPYPLNYKHHQPPWK